MNPESGLVELLRVIDENLDLECWRVTRTTPRYFHAIDVVTTVTNYKKDYAGQMLRRWKKDNLLNAITFTVCHMNFGQFARNCRIV